LKTNVYTAKEFNDLKYKDSPASQGPLDKYLVNSNSSSCEKIKPEGVHERPHDEPLQITEEGVNFVKGETIGWFEMGSTIVLIFEGPTNTVLHVEEGQKLRLGEEIVTLSNEKMVLPTD
jgi:hypothetical protein